MKQETRSTLWLVIGAALFYFLLNAISAAQGWPFKLPGISFEKFDRYAVALVATPLSLLGLSALLGVGAAYARAASGADIRHRLPVPFKLGDPDSLLLHGTQVAAFVIWPLIATVSLFIKYLGGQFCRKTIGATGCGLDGYARVGENWNHFAYVPPADAFSSREFIYQGGPDYWPFWTPVGVCVLWIVMLCILTAFLRNVFKPGIRTRRRPAVR
jgi:hypothetical protein